MVALVILVAVLPPLLLLLGIAMGVAGARWWAARRAAAANACASCASADVEAAAASNLLPLSITLPPGRKASSAKLQGSGSAIHVVASASGLTAAAPPPAGGSPLASRRGRLRPVALHTPEAASLDASAATAEEQLRCLVGGSMGGSGSLSPGGQAGGHRKTASTDLGQLVRAGPSVISQVRC